MHIGVGVVVSDSQGSKLLDIGESDTMMFPGLDDASAGELWDLVAARIDSMTTTVVARVRERVNELTQAERERDG